MKKILFIVLIIFSLLFLASCEENAVIDGDDQNPSDTIENDNTEETFENIKIDVNAEKPMLYAIKSDKELIVYNEKWDVVFQQADMNAVYVQYEDIYAVNNIWGLYIYDNSNENSKFLTIDGQIIEKIGEESLDSYDFIGQKNSGSNVYEQLIGFNNYLIIGKTDQTDPENPISTQGLFDLTTQTIVLEAIYSELMPVNKNLLFAIKDNEIGFIGYNGEMVKKLTDVPHLSDINFGKDEYLCVLDAKLEHKIGFIDTEGSWLIKTNGLWFESSFLGNYAKIANDSTVIKDKNSKYFNFTYVNRNGVPVNLAYDTIASLKNGFISMTKGQTVSILNANMNTVFKEDNAEILDLNNEYVFFKNMASGKSELYDYKTNERKEIIGGMYNYIINDYLLVKNSNNSIIYDMSGEKIAEGGDIFGITIDGKYISYSSDKFHGFSDFDGEWLYKLYK